METLRFIPGKARQHKIATTAGSASGSVGAAATVSIALGRMAFSADWTVNGAYLPLRTHSAASADETLCRQAIYNNTGGALNYDVGWENVAA